MFTLTAADNAGHTSAVTQAYEVENVNRAPEAEGDLDITVKLGELSKVTEFATIFTDPDGDEMTYSFNFPANAVADAFTTPTGVVFHGRSLGTASGTITATDSEGLSTSVKVNVTVSDNVGIDELTAGNGLISLSASAFHESLNFKSLVTAASLPRFMTRQASACTLPTLVSQQETPTVSPSVAMPTVCTSSM